jgi:choline dehydrogenase-like flavoprotein
MFADARTLSSNPTPVDVCVIGAGPAGISLARRLSGRGLSVRVLESGGTELDLPAQDLNVERSQANSTWRSNPLACVASAERARTGPDGVVRSSPGTFARGIGFRTAAGR